MGGSRAMFTNRAAEGTQNASLCPRSNKETDKSRTNFAELGVLTDLAVTRECILPWQESIVAFKLCWIPLLFQLVGSSLGDSSPHSWLKYLAESTTDLLKKVEVFNYRNSR